MNDKKFLVIQENYLNQFEVEGADNELKLNYTINLSFLIILKYLNGTLLTLTKRDEKPWDEEDEHYYEISG